MPTYKVKCNNCSKIFEEFAYVEDKYKIRCKCGGNINILSPKPYITGTIGLQTTMYGRENKPLVLEHMTEDDNDIVKVTSKQQLRDACKKHDCISHTLD